MSRIEICISRLLVTTIYRFYKNRFYSCFDACFHTNSKLGCTINKNCFFEFIALSLHVLILDKKGIQSLKNRVLHKQFNIAESCIKNLSMFVEFVRRKRGSPLRQPD